MKTTVTALALAASLTSPALADTAGWGSPDAPGCCVTLCVETVNVNTASPEQLQLLYRVGPVLAERIVEGQGRPYEAPEDLLEVKGIGEKTLAANWLWISTEGETTLSVKVPQPPEDIVGGTWRDWNQLPGCPDQSQGLDGCEPVQNPEVGTVAWTCREP